FFFSSRRRHTRCLSDWSSDVCSSDLDDVPGTVRFYSELLGLRDGPRPPLSFPGAWLYSGASAILHIVGGRSRADLKPGVIDHMRSEERRVGKEWSARWSRAQWIETEG